ncbi:hypothetical protein QMO56_10050 [Roseomonas sp. E05]|uniref:hypothetical protein n=1 Tax=Roseomonas sp. E05 TaxID=3046310 RepID=UPI0024B9B96E|nr:hypothetical protein [Roseomonas sp. E05]MDJ0388457.1 hypothetical protein [Roseomonas sp. E05]
MSDQPTLPGERREPPRDTKADLKGAASEAQARTGETARNLRNEAGETLQAVRAEGEDLATVARDKVEQVAEEQKEAGAEQGHHLAEAVRRVADDLEDASPEIARHVRSAAESVDSLATALRERSVGDLVGQVNTFAHRQPVAFFGAAMVAGFALTRFARSSARDGGTVHHSGRPASLASRSDSTPHVAEETHRNPTMAPGWVPEGTGRSGAPESGELRPATMPAATLGGAAAHKPGDARPGSMPGPAGGTL